ncbi:hypothetical protein [Verrucomicrobium spinosum]|uniref:hypothetical protein n=1 Tax=Verrucomicrobium spinosum TaxID=2736 RepID=UPI0012E1CD11|nr:hypothetical protein [Verrucomicrobium spinosum]
MKKFYGNNSMNKVRLILLLVALPLTSCYLQNYKRTYSVSYITPEGQQVGVGATFDPVKRSSK